MLPSSTVENYLKAIYLGTATLDPAQHLLPMGQLAASLGVAPGTATTMVKTLAESGLVQYEPYAGVALTAAGEKLAALVVRRHRVIELFLVNVMGYRWDEVHEEAEQLEHVVSERLIDRMDEMLGRPEVDPHGDPIPDASGIVKPQESQNLLTCPLHVRVTVTRVIDQDKVFLRFIENNNLKPGEAIEVEDRDTASDSVRVRGKGDRRITIGTRAASKLLVQVARAALLVVTLASSAFAQARPFEITDNSFFVEEAFNQEPGVFQNIVGLHVRAEGGWEAAFTQEWPLFTQRHQFSYILAFADGNGVPGVGDVVLNYRMQALEESSRLPAFSPRLSVIVPSGIGDSDAGWQVNLPFSKQVGDAYFHWNAGFTRVGNASMPTIAASGIWRARAMLNLMLESLVEFADPESVVTVSPGLRTGWNSGDAQTIFGVAVPFEFAGGKTVTGIFAYFSYELPFLR
jgi:DtxR family Mn-dependent transcriptional regulator